MIRHRLPVSQSNKDEPFKTTSIHVAFDGLSLLQKKIHRPGPAGSFRADFEIF
jgi:hypothetical protein